MSGGGNRSILCSDDMGEFRVITLQKLKNQPKNWETFMHTGQKYALNPRHIYAHWA